MPKFNDDSRSLSPISESGDPDIGIIQEIDTTLDEIANQVMVTDTLEVDRCSCCCCFGKIMHGIWTIVLNGLQCVCRGISCVCLGCSSCTMVVHDCLEHIDGDDK